MAGSQLSIKDKISSGSGGQVGAVGPPRPEKAICSQARLREAWPGDNGTGCAAGSIMILRMRAHVQNGCFPVLFFCR